MARLLAAVFSKIAFGSTLALLGERASTSLEQILFVRGKRLLRHSFVCPEMLKGKANRLDHREHRRTPLPGGI